MTPPPELGALSVTATGREGGQTLTVAEAVTRDCQRRIRVDDRPPTITYDQVCSHAAGWLDWPTGGLISGEEGQTVTVVDCLISGANARATGSTLLPAPLQPARSVNLLAYGPATGNGMTVTVNTDGSIHTSYAGGAAWQGVQYELDPSTFTPGDTYTLSVSETLDKTRPIAVTLRFNDKTDTAHNLTVGWSTKPDDQTTLALIPSVSFTLAEGEPLTRVLLLVRASQTGTVQPDFNPPAFDVAALHAQCNEGSTVLPWEKPARTDLAGGHSGVNLWTYPALPYTSNGVAFTRDGNGVRAQGATTAHTWAVLTGQTKLDAGVYMLDGPSTDSVRCYLRSDTTSHGANWRPLSTSGNTVASLPAGTYQTVIEVGSATGPVTVDETITPTLTLVNP